MWHHIATVAVSVEILHPQNLVWTAYSVGLGFPCESKKVPHTDYLLLLQILLKDETFPHAHFTHGFKFFHTNLEHWPTECCLVWKWLLCQLCFIYCITTLLTVDNGPFLTAKSSCCSEVGCLKCRPTQSRPSTCFNCPLIYFL